MGLDDSVIGFCHGYNGDAVLSHTDGADKEDPGEGRSLLGFFSLSTCQINRVLMALENPTVAAVVLREAVFNTALSEAVCEGGARYGCAHPQVRGHVDRAKAAMLLAKTTVRSPWMECMLSGVFVVVMDRFENIGAFAGQQVRQPVFFVEFIVELLERSSGDLTICNRLVVVVLYVTEWTHLYTVG